MFNVNGPAPRGGRIESIDALRGLCVILMVIYHLLYDLVVFLDAPRWMVFNPVFNFLQYVFAGCFILLAGVSSRFSRSNIKRGLIVLAAAVGITAVTWFFGMADYFGILHFMGVSMILYGLTHKFFDRIPERAAPVLYIALTAASAIFLSATSLTSPYLWALGIPAPGFSSSDYFPIFPWIFVFLLGTWLGKLVRERRLPGSFYTFSVPVFPAVGRRAFIIYLAHQPVFMGLIYLIEFFMA